MPQGSILDLYTIGIGPSSSHTVGPMRAAYAFVKMLQEKEISAQVSSLHVDCYGSLASTGIGHSTNKAIVLGLSGDAPETMNVETAPARFREILKEKKLILPWGTVIDFDVAKCVDLSHHIALPLHPNGLHFSAFDGAGNVVGEEVYYSTGGGFIATQAELENPQIIQDENIQVPYPYSTAAELIKHCEDQQKDMSEITWENEISRTSGGYVKERLSAIWQAMQESVARGMQKDGVLFGGLNVQRRAHKLHQSLLQLGEKALCDPLIILDWVNMYAIAASEENADGGRVVTAPTNGASGILPAVLHYATRFCHSPHKNEIERFLLVAGAIGLLYKNNASISGADVGCQGEVGVACSMAAGALVEYLGGTAHQVENAAEIGMEHNLGLTCDPIGGLVQIPCIERNAMGAVKAINAARLAMQTQGEHFVSLDKVMQTMLRTGHDMSSKYKETSEGGLAVNVVEC